MLGLTLALSGRHSVIGMGCINWGPVCSKALLGTKKLVKWQTSLCCSFYIAGPDSTKQLARQQSKEQRDQTLDKKGPAVREKSSDNLGRHNLPFLCHSFADTMIPSTQEGRSDFARRKDLDSSGALGSRG